MTRHWSLSVMLLVGAGLVFAGCSKTLTASSQDRASEAGPVASKPEPKAEPAPPVAEPAPKEEVRVAEPPVAEPAPRVAEAPAPAPEPPPPPAPAQSAEQPAAAAAAAKLPPDLADVFFDYDKYSLRIEASPVLDGNARLLKEENGWKLIIAGHCDERGTSAYNLVLGERRAQTVKKYLEDLGLPAAQMQVTSYGKEKPFCSDHSQECWQQNRRAHFSLR